MHRDEYVRHARVRHRLNEREGKLNYLFSEQDPPFIDDTITQSVLNRDVNICAGPNPAQYLNSVWVEITTEERGYFTYWWSPVELVEVI